MLAWKCFKITKGSLGHGWMETGNTIMQKGNLQDRHTLPSRNSVLEQALGNYCSAHVKPWCVFGSCWNGISWQPAIDTVVWTLAIIVKRGKKVTKSQGGKRWRQVWFRGTRLRRVCVSLLVFNTGVCIGNPILGAGSSKGCGVTWLLDVFW